MPNTDPSATKRPRRVRVAAAAVLLASTALGGGFAIGHFSTPAHAQAPAPIKPVAPAATLPDFSALVARVKPAVVSITTKLKTEPASMEGIEGMQHLPFPFSFGPNGPMMKAHPHYVEARGSGFIIDANGTIITNNHVIKDEKSVTVTLSNGENLPAKIIGSDPRTDIAVLRVKANHPLPYVELGDSNNVEPGQWVIAMGNPFGLGGTVTAGIVSARGRDIGAGPYDDFIQVDAPINKGNSGGPLFTQNGEVVGINTAILSPTGGSVGIGFSIPSNMVKKVVAQLEESGHVTRGYLGVSAQPVQPGMAEALNLPKNGDNEPQGALVAQVEPNSPASQAGLQAGDVIESVNGDTVKNARDLAVDIAAVKPGDDAKIDVVRDGNNKSFNVKIAELTNQIADNGQSPGEGSQQPKLGLALQAITPELRNQLDLPENAHGAIVAGVQSGSPADQAGVQPGDVVMGIGTEAVSNPAEAIRAIHRSEEKHHAVALRILRNGHPAFVGVQLPKAPEGQG